MSRPVEEKGTDGFDVWVLDCERTCSFRGFGRTGRVLSAFNGGGLAGVPIAASADVSLTAVSLDHVSYRARIAGSDLLLGEERRGAAAASSWRLLDWLL